MKIQPWIPSKLHFSLAPTSHSVRTWLLASHEHKIDFVNYIMLFCFSSIGYMNSIVPLSNFLVREDLNQSGQVYNHIEYINFNQYSYEIKKNIEFIHLFTLGRMCCKALWPHEGLILTEWANIESVRIFVKHVSFYLRRKM